MPSNHRCETRWGQRVTDGQREGRGISLYQGEFAILYFADLRPRWGVRRLIYYAYFPPTPRPLERDDFERGEARIEPSRSVLTVYGSSVMRRRLPSPVRPFDVAPPHLVEAAKRIFVYLRRNGRGRAAPMDRTSVVDVTEVVTAQTSSPTWRPPFDCAGAAAGASGNIS
jgi:hypothetical protein